MSHSVSDLLTREHCQGLIDLCSPIEDDRPLEFQLDRGEVKVYASLGRFKMPVSSFSANTCYLEAFEQLNRDISMREEWTVQDKAHAALEVLKTALTNCSTYTITDKIEVIADNEVYEFNENIDGKLSVGAIFEKVRWLIDYQAFVSKIKKELVVLPEGFEWKLSHRCQERIVNGVLTDPDGIKVEFSVCSGEDGLQAVREHVKQAADSYQGRLKVQPHDINEIESQLKTVEGWNLERLPPIQGAVFPHYKVSAKESPDIFFAFTIDPQWKKMQVKAELLRCCSEIRELLNQEAYNEYKTLFPKNMEVLFKVRISPDKGTQFVVKYQPGSFPKVIYVMLGKTKNPQRSLMDKEELKCEIKAIKTIQQKKKDKADLEALRMCQGLTLANSHATGKITLTVKNNTITVKIDQGQSLAGQTIGLLDQLCFDGATDLCESYMYLMDVADGKNQPCKLFLEMGKILCKLSSIGPVHHYSSRDELNGRSFFEELFEKYLVEHEDFAGILPADLELRVHAREKTQKRKESLIKDWKLESLQEQTFAENKLWMTQVVLLPEGRQIDKSCCLEDCFPEKIRFTDGKAICLPWDLMPTGKFWFYVQKDDKEYVAIREIFGSPRVTLCPIE